MLHKYLLIPVIFLILSACSQTAGRHVSIDYPAVDSACDGLTITHVELTDSATKVDFHLVCAEDCWVILESTAHLTSKGICYPMIGHEGLAPDHRVPMKGENHELTFTLIFSPLPPAATEFNFLEGRLVGCWSMLGVKLNRNASESSYARN